MTNGGGANGDGNIFSINTNGTGYTDMLDFNNTNGSEPDGDLTLSGGLLYGMAYQGGSFGYGVIFSINPNGTGYTVLHNFGVSGNSDGVHPLGNLTIVGSTMYGATSE